MFMRDGLHLRVKLDWNNMLRKTANECRNTVKYGIGRIIEQFVPFKKTRQTV